MRFLRKNDAATSEADTSVSADEEVSAGKTHTPGKGRPTPKRREAESRRRGPVPPPPRTTREAMKRARGSKEERKASAAQRRTVMAERRQRMNAGDDALLPRREKGPVRAYLRDLIDSRRHIAGLFMPLAALMFLSVVAPSPIVQSYLSLLVFVIVIIIVLEGVWNGNRYAKLARAKFPKETIKTGSTVFYTLTRSVTLRRLRFPKPRVNIGDSA